MAKKRDRIQKRIRPITRLDARGWAGALDGKSKEQLELLIETLPEGPKRSGAQLVLRWRDNAVHLSEPTTNPQNIAGGPPQSAPKGSLKKNPHANKSVQRKGNRSPVGVKAEKWAHMLRNETTEQLKNIVRTQTNCSKRCGAQLVLAKRSLGTKTVMNSSIAITTANICALENEMISPSTLMKIINLLATLSKTQLLRISDSSKSSVVCEIAKQNCSLITICKKPAVKPAVEPAAKPAVEAWNEAASKPVNKPRRGKYSSRLKAYAFVKHHRVRFLRAGMHP